MKSAMIGKERDPMIGEETIKLMIKIGTEKGGTSTIEMQTLKEIINQEHQIPL
jgi:hypothetical protein